MILKKGLGVKNPELCMHFGLVLKFDNCQGISYFLYIRQNSFLVDA